MYAADGFDHIINVARPQITKSFTRTPQARTWPKIMGSVDSTNSWCTNLIFSGGTRDEKAIFGPRALKQRRTPASKCK